MGRFVATFNQLWNLEKQKTVAIIGNGFIRNHIGKTVSLRHCDNEHDSKNHRFCATRNLAFDHILFVQQIQTPAS